MSWLRSSATKRLAVAKAPAVTAPVADAAKVVLRDGKSAGRGWILSHVPAGPRPNPLLLKRRLRVRWPLTRALRQKTPLLPSVMMRPTKLPQSRGLPRLTLRLSKPCYSANGDPCLN